MEHNPVLTDEGIRKIGAKYDASNAQVVISWALTNDVIQIPRSRSVNHIQTNFHLGHVKLDDADRQYIDGLDGKIQLPDDPDEATPTTAEEERRPEDSAEGNSESGKTSPEASEQDEEGEGGDEDELEKPVRDPTIIDKVFLEKKVDLSIATVFLSSDDQWIYSLDAATGTLNWKYGTAEDGGSKCVFSLDGTVVHCGTDDGYMRALKAEDGSLIWKFRTGGAVTSSPRVDSAGALYFGGVDGNFYVLNPDGSLKWEKFLGGEIWSSPALRDDGQQVFIATMAEGAPNTFSLDGKTGEILWKQHIGPLLISSPALSLDENRVFFCSLDGNCYAFDVGDGKEIWVFEADSGFHSSPAVSKSDGTLYVGSSGGDIYALDSENGKVKWRKQGEFGRKYIGENCRDGPNKHLNCHKRVSMTFSHSPFLLRC